VTVFKLQTDNPISVIAIFKQKNPINFLLLLLFGILIKLPVFKMNYVPVVEEQDAYLFKAVVNFLNPAGKQFGAFYPLLSFLILISEAVLLNRFMNSQRMLNRQNYLPGMSFLLITSLFPEWNQFSPAMISNLFLLIILILLFNTYNKPDAKGAVFNCGFLLGVSSLFFYPSLIFIGWIFLGMMVIRPFRINEWMLCLAGLITPVYFYAAYLYLTNQWDWTALVPKISIGFPDLQQSLMAAGGLSLFVFPFLTGAWYVQDNLRKMLINIRKAWSLLLLFMLAALLVPFLGSGYNFENLVLIVVPFAAFHASCYMFTRWRLIPLLFFWLSVAFIIYYQYWETGWQPGG
jgi:Family of unknown function (DUF6427)